MKFIDTHTHLYLEEFDADRAETVANAIEQGVETLLLPNIDSGSIKPMLEMYRSFPTICKPMIGLHPTSVGENYKQELEIIEKNILLEKYVAIGEIGIDLYWDKTFLKEQIDAFSQQLMWAKKHNLPVVIHSRNSHKESVETIREIGLDNLRGVFHCFGGDANDALEVVKMGFLVGIGGVVTFKNGGLGSVVEAIGVENILLETDSPYLAPVPYRGKRNQSSYIPIIAKKIADICNVSIEKVAEITTKNAIKLFDL